MSVKVIVIPLLGGDPPCTCDAQKDFDRQLSLLEAQLEHLVPTFEIAKDAGDDGLAHFWKLFVETLPDDITREQLAAQLGAAYLLCLTVKDEDEKKPEEKAEVGNAEAYR